MEHFHNHLFHAKKLHRVNDTSDNQNNKYSFRVQECACALAFFTGEVTSITHENIVFQFRCLLYQNQDLPLLRLKARTLSTLMLTQHVLATGKGVRSANRRVTTLLLT